MTTSAIITALVYATGTDPAPVLRALASDLTARGFVCAGFIQRDTLRAERSRCDMVLEDIRTGAAIAISEDRGPGARGCRLDESELTRAMVACAEALRHNPDFLFINKFGKTEAEGRGFCPLIADALERNVRVVIAVSWTNIDSWRRFASDYSAEVPLSEVSATLDTLHELFATRAKHEQSGRAARSASKASGADLDG